MDDQDRNIAVRRLKARRDFRMHLGAWIIVNGMFVGIWALKGGGPFWPGWLIVFWGVALAFHGWYAHFGQPAVESEIRREMGKDGGGD